MTYRYVKQSGQGLRYDVIAPDGMRECIAHNEASAARVVNALNRQEVEFICTKCGLRQDADEEKDCDLGAV